MSSRRAVWECKKCPAGQPHVWSAPVQARSRGTKCPYCLNRALCLHNSLATMAPQVAKYWNQSKNAKAPHQVLAASHSRAEWKCLDCKWEWQARITSRVITSAGCPKCSAKLYARGRHHPTFEKDKHPVMEEWDHERNEADGIFPHNTTHGSNKLVHWTCKCCPKGQLHRYQARPHLRTQKATGCPYCAGKQVCVCNSLESLHPSIAAELDCDRNGFTAAEVLAYSHKLVWWQNAQGRSWRQSVYTRTDKRLTQKTGFQWQTRQVARPQQSNAFAQPSLLTCILNSR